MLTAEEFVQKLAGISQSAVKKWLIWHVLLTICLIVLLFWLKPFHTESQAYFWLPFVFGLFVTIHYFVYRSFGITDEYVDERSSKLRTRSYDFDHIGDIQERVEAKHPSVTHKSERQDKSDD